MRWLGTSADMSGTVCHCCPIGRARATLDRIMGHAIRISAGGRAERPGPAPTRQGGRHGRERAILPATGRPGADRGVGAPSRGIAQRLFYDTEMGIGYVAVGRLTGARTEDE